MSVWWTEWRGIYWLGSVATKIVETVSADVRQ